MVRLFHVSDLHFGRADQAALDWFSAIVKAEAPDAVIMTGDLTMRARRHEYAAAEAWLKALGVPVTVEPGNHDLPYFNPVARFFHPYRRYERIERAVERPLSIKGVRIIPLRTTTRAQFRTNWSLGVVRPESLAAAMAELRTCGDDDVALVACHHPLLDAGTRSEGRTRGGAAAVAMLAEAGADAVLSGHVHDPFDVCWEGGGRSLRMIGAGTLSERVRDTRPSFNELRIDGQVELVQRVMA